MRREPVRRHCWGNRTSPTTIVYRIFSSLDKLKLLFGNVFDVLQAFKTLQHFMNAVIETWSQSQEFVDMPIQTSWKVTRMISSLQKHKVVFMVVFLNLFSLHFKWTDSLVFPEGSAACAIPAWSSQEVRLSAFDKWGAVWTEASSVPLQSRSIQYSFSCYFLSECVRQTSLSRILLWLLLVFLSLLLTGSVWDQLLV